MNSITAKTGFTWIVNGYGIFRQRPFLLTNLFFGYMISLMVLGIIPFIGQILPIVVMHMIRAHMFHCGIFSIYSTGRQ